MRFLLGMLVASLIYRPIRHIYYELRLLIRLRKLKKQFDGESRAQAKARAGEWRDD